MNHTHIHEDHKSAGAVFENYSGFEMPAHFGDIAVEYGAATQRCGVVDLSHRGKITMTGADRQTFLHRIVTNDISGLKPGDGTYACMLSPQGKILSDMSVYVRADDLLFDTEPGMAAVLQEILDRYALMDDVSMDDATATVGTIGLRGPEASTCLNRLGFTLDANDPMRHMTVEFDATAITVVVNSNAGVSGYDLFIQNGGLRKLWITLLECGAVSVGLETLEIIRVEAGIPRYGAELDERIIPNEAVKERAVSFEKGCYIGQEPVVMMEHRGRPNRILSGLKVLGDIMPQKDAVLQKDGQDAGWVTSAVRSPSEEGIIALGFVRRKYMKVGDRIIVELKDGSTEAEIVPLPFHEIN